MNLFPSDSDFLDKMEMNWAKKEGRKTNTDIQRLYLRWQWQFLHCASSMTDESTTVIITGLFFFCAFFLLFSPLGKTAAASSPLIKIYTFAVLKKQLLANQNPGWISVCCSALSKVSFYAPSFISLNSSSCLHI